MIGTINAKSNEEIKSFLSSNKDTYRILYQQYSEDRSRQCVFAGITNTKQFLLTEVHAEQAEMHLLADEEESRTYIDQTNLTLEEVAAYSSIGTGKLREITNSKNCKFVLWVGSKRLIKRRLFDQYIEEPYSI